MSKCTIIVCKTSEKKNDDDDDDVLGDLIG